MLCLKKVHGDELLQLALILSLLRVQQESILFAEPAEQANGTIWSSYHVPNAFRPSVVHRKSLDSLLVEYEREVFADLNSLGRYNRLGGVADVTAYLLDVERTGVDGVEEQRAEEQPPETLELTQEDMDLIEVLWKQDVDLGFCPDTSSTTSSSHEESGGFPEKPEEILDKEEEDAKVEKEPEKAKDGEEDGPVSLGDDSWPDLSEYTIDTETGEYILKTEQRAGSESPPTPVLGDFPLGQLLDELAGLGDSTDGLDADVLSPPDPESCDSSSLVETDELDLLADMLQTFPHSRPPTRPRPLAPDHRWQELAGLLSLPDGGPPYYYGPETRGVLLHNASLAAPCPTPTPTTGAPGVPEHAAGFGPVNTNLGTAVAASLNLSEPLAEAAAGHFKPDHDMLYYPGDLNQTTDGFLSSILNDEDLQLMDMAVGEGMYTMRALDGAGGPGASAAAAAAAGGPSVTAGCGTSAGGIGVRSIQPRADPERMDASSDSAVSSMGSEAEWCEAGAEPSHLLDYHHSHHLHHHHHTHHHSHHSHHPSHPGHPHQQQQQQQPQPHQQQHQQQQQQQGKYGRPYGYGYASPRPHVGQPVAQKKHQMFGKRHFQDQPGTPVAPTTPAPALPLPSVKYEYASGAVHPFGEGGSSAPRLSDLKYSCSMDFSRHVSHNHTYHMPAESAVAVQRPLSRDKSKAKKNEDEHLTRDEKRARALNVPLSVDDIINLPMDEFNERLSKYDLSESQLSLIRDIRRRGKNKVAAQNCRKRKLDQILSLADEVKGMKDRKNRLINERDFMIGEQQRVKDKFAQLYRHVFQNLRDPDGNQYSPYQYSLQQSADGSVLLVPRANSTMIDQDQKKENNPHSNNKE